MSFMLAIGVDTYTVYQRVLEEAIIVCIWNVNLFDIKG